jgi:hypothetical protein
MLTTQSTPSDDLQDNPAKTYPAYRDLTVVDADATHTKHNTPGTQYTGHITQNTPSEGLQDESSELDFMEVMLTTQNTKHTV